MKIYADQTSYW